MLAACSAYGGMSASFTDVGTLSSSVLAVTQSVTVVEGDVIVMVAGSNKKASAQTVSFASAAGTFADLDANTVVGGDPNPNTYLSYLIVGAAGIYDFVASYPGGGITANIGLYHLSADSGAITLLANDAQQWSGLSLGTSLTVTNSLSWSSDPLLGEIAVVGVASSLKGVIDSADLTINDNNSSKRLAGSTSLTTGAVYYDIAWDINAAADEESGSVVAAAFAEASNTPQPPSFKSDPVLKPAAVQDEIYIGSLADDASDPNSDEMTFSIDGDPVWLNVATNGDLSGTPLVGDLGTNIWTVFVTDGISGTNSAQLEIVVLPGPPEPQTSQTNVILIVIDDLGWMDLSVQGSQFYETPRIDELAANGMRFTQGYAAHPRCLPSRYGLMTGRFPGASAVPADAPDLIDEEVTIGEALQTGGYATFFAGKWHISHEDALLPQRQGFDINITGGAPGSPPSYFYPYGNEPANELDGNGLFLDNATPIGGMVTDRITGISYRRTYQAGESGEYITDRLTDEALDWMVWHADKPLFLYMSHYGVHTPYEAPASLVAKYQAKLASMDYGDLPEYISVGVGEQKMRQDHPIYAAMIESVDTNIGRLIDKVNELGIAGNTVFIFTSDNGGLSNRGGYNTRELATSNYPLRTGKGWLYEGGIREAFIVKGPGIPAMVNSNAVINGTDIYPTILELTGQPFSTNDHRNGVSFKTALTGAPYDRGEPILWHSPLARPYSTGDFNSSALRDGDYKLIWWYDTPGRDGEFHYELYNVKDDPGETVDLSLSMPAKAADLLAQIKAWHNHEYWERSVGVIMRTDADDVSKPPAPYLDNPYAPLDLTSSSGNIDLSWGDWIGYDYNVWSKTNLLDVAWTVQGSGLITTNTTVPASGPSTFFRLELVLQPEN